MHATTHPGYSDVGLLGLNLFISHNTWQFCSLAGHHICLLGIWRWGSFTLNLAFMNPYCSGIILGFS